MPDDVSISGTNAEVMASIATANAAETAGNHDARAAAATRALQQMADARRTIPSETPKNAVEAGQRLDHLNRDPAFRSRFLNGEVSARREFELLTTAIAAADPTELAIAGVEPPGSVDMNAGGLPDSKTQVQGAAHLRELGLSDSNIRRSTPANCAWTTAPS
jgi:hypothetical protein